MTSEQRNRVEEEYEKSESVKKETESYDWLDGYDSHDAYHKGLDHGAVYFAQELVALDSQTEEESLLERLLRVGYTINGKPKRDFIESLLYYSDEDSEFVFLDLRGENIGHKTIRELQSRFKSFPELSAHLEQILSQERKA